ncbi:hypothetical protein S1OALGB6SA_924 [Olavius algarvensis spirochete endosymbiont]|uniref:hypothetical protein n=1 Tax=Olavius algarvensis spirochete endosymbiont TaxID=260710 RepID=UPI000F1E29AA|nr:hypothetical protein [Olavius algarvensis spirochete endosymbiont]VDA99851.1 hypothetical protein S1OALGB6SA_924 [Olavius algarvensis spirochete endosymbiont]
MALIKLDHAYCHEFDSVLTIYQVRDLHFDDDASFDARNAKFECPDEDCNAPLVGVNHASVKFKNTPHFRLLIDHKHSEACDYGNESNMKASDESKRKGTERNYKASYHPEVLLLERQPPPSGTGKPKKKRKAANPQTTVDASLSNSNSDNFSPHKTSCLEHVVEIWVSNDAEVLQYLPLTIGDKNKNYQNAFKNINSFTDEEGLIYWGHVKSIKDYGKNYAITFKERPWFEGENRQISIYIRNELIESYRKRKMFRSWIDSLLKDGVSGVKCFFVGTYPTLKEVPVKTSTGSFCPLEVHLKNLDHLVLRFNGDGKDL